MAESFSSRDFNRPPDHKMLSRTLILMLVCGVGAFMVLIGKLFEIQIIHHDFYESAAIDQQLRDTSVTADRGTIYDRNMNILAQSATVETVYISPAEIAKYNEDIDLISDGLSDILGVDRDKIYTMAKDKASWYKTVARKIDNETALRVRQFKNDNSLSGIKLEPDTKRYYPYNSLASHVIGFVGSDNTGLSGVELVNNSTLTGTNGVVQKAKNAYGTDMLYTKYENYVDGQMGCSLVLTLDRNIQYYTEKYLSQAIEDYEASGGAAICMNVNTGEVLAMTSYGNFDLNNYQLVSDDAMEEIQAAEEDKRQELLTAAQFAQWRNKAIEDSYEPGSTFKIITLAAALDSGAVSLNDSFSCGGYIEVTGDSPGHGRHCWRRTGHGGQTLTQAVQHSCNVAFIRIGQRTGAETFYDYVERFGFFEKTGIDLVGEATGLWWDRDLFCSEKNKTQLAAASFGQTFTITPIQLITAVCACANGGNLMQPYLVKSVLDPQGNVLSEIEPTVRRRVISEETSRQVCQILEQVVCDKTEGTGKNAYVAGYRVAGKTGTSVNTVLEAGGTKQYIVSFIGFAPADDPEVCLLVLIDDPKSQTVYISGGNMGAPTVGNMLSEILPYVGVEPQYTEEEKKAMDKAVPMVEGLSREEAEKKLKDSGLSCKIFGDGDAVTSQLPSPGNVIASGSQVSIYLDSPPENMAQEMPDIVGLTYSEARRRLDAISIYIKTDYSGLPTGDTVTVTHQNVPPGKVIIPGTVVEVSLADRDDSINGRY